MALSLSENRTTKIFGDGLPGISRKTMPIDKDHAYQYITLAGTNPMGAVLDSILLGRAPADEVTISDTVDLSQNKALSGDYLIATFGHNLTRIIIDGMDIYGMFGSCYKSSDSTVMDFYNIYNVYNAKDARVNISLSKGTADRGKTEQADPITSQVYTCILVALICKAAGNTPGIGTYRMELLGVRL